MRVQRQNIKLEFQENQDQYSMSCLLIASLKLHIRQGDAAVDRMLRSLPSGSGAHIPQ